MAVQQSPIHSVIAGDVGSWVDRHGYLLPAVFSEADEEYRAAVTGAALHDASYWGRLKATGADALDLLNRLSTNQVIDLSAGMAAPTVLTTDRGRIIDLLWVVNQGDHLLLLTSPGRQQTVIDWLDKYTIMEDLVVEDITGQTAMLALLGPLAASVPRESLQVGPESGTRFSAWEQRFGECETLVIERPLGKLPCFYLVAADEGRARTVAPLGGGPGYRHRRRGLRVHSGEPGSAGLRQRIGRALQPVGSRSNRVGGFRQGLLYRPRSHRPAGQLPQGAKVLGLSSLRRRRPSHAGRLSHPRGPRGRGSDVTLPSPNIGAVGPGLRKDRHRTRRRRIMVGAASLRAGPHRRTGPTLWARPRLGWRLSLVASDQRRGAALISPVGVASNSAAKA